MGAEEVLDLDKVFIEVTLHNHRRKTFPITSAVFVWDGGYGSFFGVDYNTLESFIAREYRRRFENGKTRLGNIFNECAYIKGNPNGFILLMHSTGERRVRVEFPDSSDSVTEELCQEYKPIFTTEIKEIAVLVEPS